MGMKGHYPKLRILFNRSSSEWKFYTLLYKAIKILFGVSPPFCNLSLNHIHAFGLEHGNSMNTKLTVGINASRQNNECLRLQAKLISCLFYLTPSNKHTQYKLNLHQRNASGTTVSYICILLNSLPIFKTLADHSHYGALYFASSKQSMHALRSCFG